ncbi:hypothetical protein SLEP1_g3524 [Rubroshorea leprosula]|uniref:Uncharacterized protein n=1 Tax=Rubroshorea leprosula TaxID=152421 RepID=A0AAV5HS60_9ROSI|nr:hypothetical protein SLEP1_g3524 [Rubroshorea leprosula]
MREPNSLAARVLKAKYFRRTDFLHSREAYSASLTWKGIWEARYILQAGCRRRIGNGRSTRVWEDPWLPGSSCFNVVTPRANGCEVEWVSELIDDVTHSWRRELVYQLFSEYEAQLVLSIPLSWRSLEDDWVWQHTREGCYSVKSGYHVACHSHQNPQQPSSSAGEFRGQILWRLELPERIKVFLWSAYRDILPTKENLRKRRVDIDNYCPVCGEMAETGVHVLKDCQFARAVWLGSQLNLRVADMQVDSFAEFFDTVALTVDQRKLALFGVVCWSLWNNRNDILWESKRQQPQHVCEMAVRFLQEYGEAVRHKCGTRGGPRRGEIKWEPPDESHFKVNVDGALFQNSKEFGVGAVVRDCNGEVIAAMSCRRQGTLRVEAVEAYGLRGALQWAYELGLRKIIVECDCAVVVQWLGSQHAVLLSELGGVLADCKGLMDRFNECRVQHVRRAGNQVAHELARRAEYIAGDEFWVEEVPDPIKAFVLNDMA